MTEDKRLEEIRTNLVDAKKAMQIPWFWSNEDIEMLLSEIDRLKEENEAYLIGGSMFAETGLSQSKKIKELEDHRDILVNSFAELTEDEITKEDVLNVLKQHDSLDSDIARIATLEAKLKQAEEGLWVLESYFNGSVDPIKKANHRLVTKILKSIRDKGSSDD